MSKMKVDCYTAIYGLSTAKEQDTCILLYGQLVGAPICRPEAVLSEFSLSCKIDLVSTPTKNATS